MLRRRSLWILWAVLPLLGGGIAFAQSFQSLSQAGDAALAAGHTNEAEHDYRAALALRPGWTEGWWNLGAAQYQANQYSDAAASLRKLTELAPKAAAGWSLLGLSEFETGHYSDALASLERAQSLGGIGDPDIQRVSSYHLALLLIHNGEFERAATLLRGTFGSAPPQQAKTALGLALLRVPLLPKNVDPSKDAQIAAAGEAAASSDAVHALAEFAAQYPQTPWAHYAYGLALAKAGEQEQAAAQFRLEAAISPRSPLPHRALAKALAAMGQTRQAAVEQHEAERLAQDTTGRSPRMIALYAARGASEAQEGAAGWSDAMRDYSAGEYAKAVAALKIWVEQNPGDGTAWAVMGLSEFALKDYGNARVHLQRGIRLGVHASPQAEALAIDRLALLMIRNGKFDSASALLSPLARASATNGEVRLALGLALFHIAVLPENLNAEQRDLAGQGGTIVELLLASRYPEAFAGFEKLIAAHPETPWLHYAYGDALNDLSEYDKARTEMQAETKISPKSALPWIRIASIDVRQHMAGDALEAAHRAVALAPGSAEAHYQLGRAWLESGDAQRAIAELNRANGLRPGSPEIHFALARAYSRANLPEKAAAERTIFLQLKAAHQAGSGTSILQGDARR